MSPVPAKDSQTTETRRVATPVRQRYTLLAVQQGEQWASLCRELDIPSCGATAEEALDMLERAIADALRYERDTGVAPGQPVPRADWEAFAEEGRGPDRAASRTVTL